MNILHSLLNSPITVELPYGGEYSEAISEQLEFIARNCYPYQIDQEWINAPLPETFFTDSSKPLLKPRNPVVAVACLLNDSAVMAKACVTIIVDCDFIDEHSGGEREPCNDLAMHSLLYVQSPDGGYVWKASPNTRIFDYVTREIEDHSDIEEIDHDCPFMTQTIQNSEVCYKRAFNFLHHISYECVIEQEVDDGKFPYFDLVMV